jgi:hypothetical protein
MNSHHRENLRTYLGSEANIRLHCLLGGRQRPKRTNWMPHKGRRRREKMEEKRNIKMDLSEVSYNDGR